MIKVPAENVAIVDKNKKYKFEDGDMYFYITHTGDTRISRWIAHGIDKSHLNFGNIYRTQEEAEKAILNIRIRNKLRMFAEEINGEWRPNWEDHDEIKWYCVYNESTREWLTVEDCFIHSINEIYFKTEELAKRAIEEVLKPFEQKER